jgi:hypothetical protein
MACDTMACDTMACDTMGVTPGHVIGWVLRVGGRGSELHAGALPASPDTHPLHHAGRQWDLAHFIMQGSTWSHVP